MARKRERIMALALALAFLVPTLGVSGILAWQVIQEGKQDNSAVDTTDTNTNENRLAGTKMDDFTPVAKVDELKIIDLEVGTGEEVKASDTITFDYTGALAKDGTIFESSLDGGQSVTFALSDLIKGWQEGIPGMKVGGKRRLLIPAANAYGETARDGIPANSDLVFDITVHERQSK
jgi:FKBP-type peptidyl-prolyl cis-trans isomerase